MTRFCTDPTVLLHFYLLCCVSRIIEHKSFTILGAFSNSMYFFQCLNFGSPFLYQLFALCNLSKLKKIDGKILLGGKWAIRDKVLI